LQAVELDAAYRERIQARQLYAYMYGETIKPPPGVTSYLLGRELATDLTLAPATATVSFDDITIYRIGEGPLLHPRAPACGNTHTAQRRSRRRPRCRSAPRARWARCSRCSSTPARRGAGC
jgi:hypothetical protein